MAAELALEASPNDRDQLLKILKPIAEGDVFEAEINNLDGSPETILLIAQVAATALAGFGPIIAAYLSRTRPISKIRIEKDGVLMEVQDVSAERAVELFEDFKRSIDKKPPESEKDA